MLVDPEDKYVLKFQTLGAVHRADANAVYGTVIKPLQQENIVLVLRD